MKKLLTLAISAILATIIFATGSSAAIGTVSGESNRISENIYLSDGTDTGVTWTQMNLSGTYGSNKLLNVVEGSLSNTNLSLEVLNCGSKLVSRTLLSTAAKNASVNEKTVLAAINGDLWMTNVNSNSNVTTKTLCTSRGIVLIDGEIWATQEFGMENYANTSNAGTTASLKSAIGVTKDNQPVVGYPVYTLSLTNTTQNKKLTADGLNRLPAWNSLVVYNSRLNSSNYALNDSYEIELSTTDSAFTLDGKVEATVEAIYIDGSTQRPSLSEGNIVLTARGSRIADISSFKVGDKVSFDISLIDKAGRTELWQNVTDAIGGHMQTLKDGRLESNNPSASEYPTALIGIKADGTVMMATVTANADGAYKGLKFKDSEKLCRELGYNDVFYLDGGGSTTMITLEVGSYTVRNKCSDGSPRSVINGIALVWNDTPVVEKQGSLGYISFPEDYSNLNPQYISGSLLQRIAVGTNQCFTQYSQNSLKITADQPTIDPFVSVDFTGFTKRLNAADYKYIVLKVKSDYQSGFSLFYCVGANTSASASYTTSFNVGTGYTYITVNTAALAGWSGNINSFRLDPLEGRTSQAGDSAYIEFIAFCKTATDAQNVQKGIIPQGSVKDFYAYKDCNGIHTYKNGTSLDSLTHRVFCQSCGIENVGSHDFEDFFTVDIEAADGHDGLKSRHCKYCNERCDITVIIGRKKGDINGDNSVSPIDLNLIKRITAGYVADSNGMYAADINSDGSINTIDLNLLKRLLTN